MPVVIEPDLALKRRISKPSHVLDAIQTFYEDKLDLIAAKVYDFNVGAPVAYAKVLGIGLAAAGIVVDFLNGKPRFQPNISRDILSETDIDPTILKPKNLYWTPSLTKVTGDDFTVNLFWDVASPRFWVEMDGERVVDVRLTANDLLKALKQKYIRKSTYDFLRKAASVIDRALGGRRWEPTSFVITDVEATGPLSLTYDITDGTVDGYIEVESIKGRITATIVIEGETVGTLKNWTEYSDNLARKLRSILLEE